jgi:branched-chain amino acid transport system substrate-binding protein
MTRATRSLALASASMLLLGSVAACGSSKSSGSPTASSSSSSGSNGKYAVSTAGCQSDVNTALAAGAPIKIGTSQPLSGPLAIGGASVVAGMNAYFKKINDAGGIDGHKIQLVSKDDALDAGRAATNAQAFVGQEKVFADLSQINSAEVDATQAIYEAACVPQLWVIATTPYSDPEKHPWTISGQPTASIEGKAEADYIAKKKPGGSVTEMKDSGTFGHDLNAAFPARAKEDGLKVDSAITIPAGATNIDAQVSAAVAGSPDAILLESLGNFAPGFLTGLARAHYKGMIMLSSGANAAAQWITPSDPAGEGASAPLFQKDPSDARWKDDPAIKEYMADMSAAGQPKMAPLANAADGYLWAELLVQNIKDASAMAGGLTRANLMSAAWNVNTSLPLLIHPEVATSGTQDPVLVEAGEIGVYSVKDKGFTLDYSFDYSGKSSQYLSNLSVRAPARPWGGGGRTIRSPLPTSAWLRR